MHYISDDNAEIAQSSSSFMFLSSTALISSFQFFKKINREWFYFCDPMGTASQTVETPIIIFIVL